MEFKFEDKIEALDDLIRKNRGRWKLTSITHLDYDDVAQMIRIRILEKWPLWDQNRPFERWANEVIVNKIQNIIRDQYNRYAPPCIRCPHDRGGDFCGYTPSGVKCEECPIYKNWARKKQEKFFLKTASSIDHENFQETAHSHSTGIEIDIEASIPKFHKHMMSALTPRMALFYNLIYIKEMNDKDICEIKTAKGKNLINARQLVNIKNTLLTVGKEEIMKFDFSN